MPKQKKEINIFDQGIAFNADEQDIPINSAAFSLNVDPVTENGILAGINANKLTAVIDELSCRVIFPLTYSQNGINLNKISTPQITDNILCVENIDSIKDSTLLSSIGTKGYRETFQLSSIVPHMERLIVDQSHLGNTTSTTYGVIDFDSRISKTDVEIPTNGSGSTASLISNLSVNDYLQFNSTTTFKDTFNYEIMKVLSVDTDNNKITVRRGAYKSIPQTYSNSASYHVFINKISYNFKGEQVSTNSGYITGYNWQDIGGNHIKGNDYLQIAQTDSKHTVTGESNKVVFDADSKSMTISGTNNLHRVLQVGDHLTIYTTAHGDSNNHGSTFKIQGINSSNNTYYFTTAPVSETVSTSTTFYFESGLIKNPTFFHKSASSGVGDDQIYKANDWYLTEKGPSVLNGNVSSESSDTGAIVQASGNIYTDTNLFGSDLSANYYPYSAKKLTLVSKFMKLGLGSTISDFTTGETLLETTDHTSTGLMEIGYSKGDIIYIDNNSDGTSPTEYAKVKKVTPQGLILDRGLYSTSEANHSGTNYVYKNVGYEINQDINKDRLKHDTEYELTFWAKIDTATAATTTLTCVHDTASNYDEKDFILVSSAGTTKTYTFETTDAGDGSTDTGDLDGDGKVIIQINGLSDKDDIAEQTRLAIVHANGHNGEITASRTDNALALAQAYSGESGNTEVTTTANVAHFTCPSFSGGTSPEGTFSIEVNGGYFNENGKWIPYTQEAVNVGYELNYNTPARTFRHNTFNYCLDTRGIPSEENRIIDNIKWRQLSYRFKTPKTEIKTDMKLMFGNIGPKDSQISICNINLSEEAIIYNANKDAGFMSSAGFIDNHKIKTLIGFDSSNSTLRIFENFSADNINTEVNLEVSSSTSSLIKSTDNHASFVNKNKEVHIGYGPSLSDTSPQWLGYINHKIFGEEVNNLYLDNDVVGTYDTLGTSNINKICLAGEFECVTAVWTQSNTTLTVDMGSGNKHYLNAGDNIIVREYLDAANAWDGSGVWFVSALDNAAGDDSARYFRCKRKTAFDANPSEVSTDKIFDLDKDGTKDHATGKISFRPYYYYGIKRGEPYIYRIFPDARIKDNTGTLSNDVDSTYAKGIMERSPELPFNVNSICCSYAKNTNSGAIGVDGGHIYALADEGDRVYRLNVMIKYDSWPTAGFTTTETIDMEYRSFKWSNLRTDGNIGASEYVFDSSSLVSSPIINANGIPSDIIETKGPASTFDWADSDDNDASDVTPDNMDNRLWVQFYPGETSTFTDGDRFLFCSRSTYLTGTNTVQFADRTPPTVTRYPGIQSFYFNQLMDDGDTETAQGGYRCNTGAFLPGNDESELLKNSRICGGSANVTGYNFDSNEVEIGDFFGGSAGLIPYTEHGNNLGWDGSDGTPSSIYVAKYGLFQIADNDGDGLLDGTGVVVPNTSNINTSSLPYKPYGDLGRRMSSHAVGLIGGSDKLWMKKCGRVFTSRYTESTHGQGSSSFTLTMANTREGKPPAFTFQRVNNTQDTPEFMKAEKCIFVCTDMHFGDKPQKRSYDISNIGASENFGNNADHHTQITTSEDHELQAGDLVYFDGTGGWPGWGNSYYITSVESSTIFHVTVVHGGDYTGDGKIYVGGFQRNHMSTNSGASSTLLGARGVSPSFHFAFNTDSKNNGSIFNEHGGFGRLWYTDQNNHGINNSFATASSYSNSTRAGIFPPMTKMVEQLNWQSGFMIRPFDMDNEGFQDLIIGDGISVDMPCFPDVIYHTGNHVKTDVSTGVGNLKASRLFISSETPVDENTGLSQSKLYVCDWPTLLPNDSSRVNVQTGSVGWSGGSTGLLSSAGSLNDSYHRPTHKPLFYGIISDTYVSTAANTDYLRDATYHPIISVRLAHSTDITATGPASWYMQTERRNALAGLYITVIDQTNGYTQTRKIIGNMSSGADPAVNHMKISVHFPFSKIPAVNDNFYIYSGADIATSPVRLLREIDMISNNSLDNVSDLTDFIINQKDHIIEHEFYQDRNLGTYTASSSGTTGTLDKLAPDGFDHNLQVGDLINIQAHNYANNLWNGTYEVQTITDEDSFTITTTESNIAAINSDYAQQVIVTNLSTSNRTSNPIVTRLNSPAIKMNYGDLDMRKLKPLTVTSIDGDHETNPDVAQLTTTASHLLSAGDYITLQEAASDTTFVGNYIIKSVADGATKIDVYHTSSSNPSDDYNLIQNQWGGLATASKGATFMSEIRSAFTEWDTGNSFANSLRDDVSELDVASQYMRVDETSVVIQSASTENTSGFFKKDTNYQYKISLMYDGYQEGSLSNNSFLHNQSTTISELSIKISITNFSNRLTHVCIYRSDDGGFYRLVRQIPTNTGWTKDTDKFVYTFNDSGKSESSYEARTGTSEVMNNLSIKYGLSCESEGYLFAGNCSHINIKDASNQIFRSKPGKFSIFDWSTDFVILNSTPTAMVSFAGKLIVFDNNNLYKINPHSLVIEDIFEGVGCSGPNSVIVTEYSMFFANRQGAYMYDNQKPTKISTPIQKGGGSNILSLSNSSILGSNEIHDLSWDNTAGNIQTKQPSVVFDSKSNLVYFIVEYFNPEDIKYGTTSDVTSRYKVNKKRSYIWCYSFEKQRWDLWELSNNDDIVGVPFTNENGDVFISIGNGLFHLKGSPNKLLYSWLSKKLTMNTSLINKVFNKVKIIGPKKNLIIDGDHKNDSDKLILATDAGRITSGSNSTSSNITYKSDGTNSADYKLGSSNKRGKWLQVLLEDMDEEVEATAIIYRMRAIK